MNRTLPESAYVELTLRLLADLGLPSSWQVKASPNMGRRLGTCNYTKQLIRLNAVHLKNSSHEEIMDTIHHEVAHAVARLRFGIAIKPHGAEWKSVARELGATPRASVAFPRTDSIAASVLTGPPRTRSAAPKATSLPLSKGRQRNRRRTHPITASFHSEELGRSIRAGDKLTLQGKQFEVIETKRTRFTGVGQHDGQMYSIPASLIPHARFS